MSSDCNKSWAVIGAIIWLTLLLCPSKKAWAYDIFLLYQGGCSVSAGAIVRTEGDQATILNLSGQLEKVDTRSVDLIARYNVLENPFPKIIHNNKTEGLYWVRSRSSEKSFLAYAVQFYADLILFLDGTGRIRVVEKDQIVSLKHPTLSKMRKAPASPSYELTALAPPPAKDECGPERGPSASPKSFKAVAKEVIADKLRLNSFWVERRRGYRNLRSLRERTLFYVRPVLFDQKTRLGLTAIRSNWEDLYKFKREAMADLPLYLEFGSGEAYRFQSSTSFGNKSWRLVPQVNPVAGVRSSFKSHLIHGTLLANLNGLIAGKPLFIDMWTPRNENMMRKKVWGVSSFNHLTLLGADFGSYSLSYGYYFPTFAFGQGKDFREVTSPNSSPVMRFGYLRPRWQVELFLFRSQIDGGIEVEKGSELDPDHRFGGGSFVRFYSESLSPYDVDLSSQTARLDFTWWPTAEFEVRSDISFTKTQYSEKAVILPESESQGTEGGDSPLSGPKVKSHINQVTLGGRLSCRMDLGQWVALKGEVSVSQIKTEGGFKTNGDSNSDSVEDLVRNYIFAMELLL